MGGNKLNANGERDILCAVEHFLFWEARLLDEQRYEEWADLFTADGTYWMPATVDQPDPKHHVSLIYEDRLLRTVRIRRYRSANAFSLQPRPRSIHLVSNVMIDGVDAETGDVDVNSRIIMLEFRRDRQQVYGASCRHELCPDGDTFRIRHKKVELANCEGMHENIQIYL